ncbi:Tyrosine-sulfated glycopeptide receptor 1 [Zea mays]|uniref:non-specific serine/threonine protein kinase n=1 Tax=Zea mays TaxID=4577 RepID=A0A1D6H150_MAIZE|nr:Tyrosine-sulfated glycopeptide receptor 1 [Zea mays]
MHFTNITNTLQILKNCRNLTSLLIGSNFKGEDMPEDETIDGFQNLQVLSMSNCSLSGKIPLWLSKLKNLQVLLLHTNQLSGTIPAWIKSLESLFHLDISSNKLTGEIPTALMEMPMLTTEKTATHLDPRVFELPVYKNPSLQYRITSALPKLLKLGYNNLTGAIPQEIGQLKSLAVLNFSSNNLSGKIPLELCNLTNLQVLDLSNNHLRGAIPSALNNLHFLSALNISYNNLEGPIPTGGQFSTFSNNSFEGNPKLCGPILHHSCSSAVAPTVSTKQHSRKAIFGIAFGSFFGVALLLLLVYLAVSFKCKRLIKKSKISDNEDVEATSHVSDSEQSLVIVPRGEGGENKLKFADIVKATNNFHQGNIIGCGGYGLVYKAILPDGTKLAIKKLNGEMLTMEREFKAEVEALSMAQHENLVPLWGYYIQGDSRLLVYSYMENGSLDDWLHTMDDDASTFLSWPMRLKIAQGASQGLSYIHDVCKPHIVHRDIKSSNILLDKDFKAYVADFGLSRLVLANKTHVTTELVGTLGYIPPEYGQGWVATLRGDIYSFGVVLLELLTGRRPVSALFLSKELVKWVQEMKSEGKQIEVLDPHLRGLGHDEQMLKVLEIACKCVDHDACMRPTILEVASCLDTIEPTLRMQNSVRI